MSIPWVMACWRRCGDQEVEETELGQVERRAAERRGDEKRYQERNAEIQALEQTMDPILATREWNRQNSPLLRLPDELLLRILKMLDPKPVDLFMLRRVSRKLQQLLGLPEVNPGGMLPPIRYEDTPHACCKLAPSCFFVVVPSA